MQRQSLKLPDTQVGIDAVEESGFDVIERRRLQNGDQVKLSNGAVVNFYDSGKVYVSGTNVDEVWASLERKAKEVYGAESARGQAADVAVICLPGFDDHEELADLLRLAGLPPSLLAVSQPCPDPLLTRLDKVTTGARFAVIAVDELALSGDKALLQEQIPFALAVGVALGRFKQSGVVVLFKGKVTPDWLTGITCLRYENDLVGEVGLKLGATLKGQGFDIKPESFLKPKVLAPPLPAKRTGSVATAVKKEDEKQIPTPRTGRTRGRPKGSTNKKGTAGQEKAVTGRAATQRPAISKKESNS
jgi:predicted nucleotide-binding protein